MASRYTTDRGLALVFYGKEGKFKRFADAIAASLTDHNFEANKIYAEGIIGHVETVFGSKLGEADFSAHRDRLSEKYKRFAFVFCGHGGFSSTGSENTELGGLCHENGTLVSVRWILTEASAVFPSSVDKTPASPPKVFILNCCYSPTTTPCVAPGSFKTGTVRARGVEPKDFIILRSAQPGRYSYSTEDRSYALALSHAMDCYLGDPHFTWPVLHDVAAAEVAGWAATDPVFGSMTPFKADHLRHVLLPSTPLFDERGVEQLDWDRVRALRDDPASVLLGRGASGEVSGAAVACAESFVHLRSLRDTHVCRSSRCPAPSSLDTPKSPSSTSGRRTPRLLPAGSRLRRATL